MRLADFSTGDNGENVEMDALAHLTAVVQAAIDPKTSGKGKVTIVLKAERTDSNKVDLTHEVKPDMPRVKRYAGGKKTTAVEMRQGELFIVPPAGSDDPIAAIHEAARAFKDDIAETIGEGTEVTFRAAGREPVRIEGRRRARGGE